MSVEKSLKQIIYEVSEIEKAHKQTRSFHFGDLLDIIKKGKINYASIFMSVNNATTDENFTTLTVELYAFDILAQDDANRVDVENTTQQILDDFITIIRYSTRWNNFCEVDSSVPERKFYDTLQDRLSGWSATIQIKVYRNDCLVGLPIDDYDFDQHGNFEAVVMAFVQNSEGTILASKLVSDSDDVIPVPNITITDTDGTEIDYPSGKNFACTPPTCEDADIFINGVEVSNVPSGGTVDLQVVNEDDEQVGAWDGSEWVVPAPEIINTANLTKTGQTTSYAANDDGDLQRGRDTDFFTLADNNPFGNLNRFTDTLGGQVYADNIIIDWAQWNNKINTVNGYALSINSSTSGTQTWANWMTNSPYTVGAFSGWVVANYLEVASVLNFENNPQLNYAPFNINEQFWCSTTRAIGGLSSFSVPTGGAGLLSTLKTSNFRALLVRTFTLAELGL